MDKIKVFHLTDHLPNYHSSWGGAEQVAYRYLKLLSGEEKIDVLVGSVKPENPVKENFKFIRIRVLEDFFPQKLQIYVTGIKNRILSFDPLAFLNLFFVFWKEKPDVIHLHKTNKISFAAILAAKILRKKVILAMYDYWYLCPAGMLIDQKGNLCKKFHGSWCKDCSAVSNFRFLLPLTSGTRRPIFDFFYRLVDGFVVLSDSQGKILRDYGIPKQKIFLIRQVFDFNQNGSSAKTQKNLILFAGWLDPRKGLHILIKAMTLIKKTVPDVSLAILKLQGIKGYEENIIKLAKTLKIDKHVKFYGRLTKNEFDHFINMAETIVVPEQWENMSPVIIIEAMAKGKTIVASRIGGIPEFIKDNKNGLLVERTNVEEFAGKIVWVLEHPLESRRLGQQGAKDIVKICDKTKILNDLLNIYQQMV